MSETAAKPGPGNVANLPAKTSFKPLKQCATLAEAFRTQEFYERISASVPQHVQPNRMLRLFEQSVTKTPLLAEATVRSFVGACLTLSQVGLEPNTPLGHGYLIPFKTKVYNPVSKKRDQDSVEINVIFGYPGLLDLSYRTKLVRAVHADVVWPGDEFSFEYGSDAHVRHKPKGMRGPNDRPVYAYMHATLADGQAFEVMPYSEVLAIRDKSQAYRFAVELRDGAEAKGWSIPRGYTEAPWVAHEIAMARKTVFRSGSKWLPRSVEVASVIALDEAQDRRRSMDFGSVMDAPTIDGKVDYLGAAVDEAERREDGPTDPGTAFGDRRDPAEDAAKAKAAEDAARAKIAAEDAAKTAERKRKLAADQAEAKARAEAARKPAAPEFEAFLIDHMGDPTGPSIANSEQFAKAFLMLWREADEVEQAEAIEALIAYNADALDQIRADYPAAAKLLAEMDEPHELERQTENQTSYAAVVPPIERGKTSWPGYVKLIRAEVENHGRDTLPGWLDMQKTALSEAPFAQRLLAIRAISDRISAFGLSAPVWLGDLMRAPKPAEAPPADPRAADEKWVERTVAEIQAIKTRAEFDSYFKSSAIRTVMLRLKESAPDLFDRADAAFGAKHAALPPIEGSPA